MAYSQATRILIGCGILSLVFYSADNSPSQCYAADVPSKNQNDEAKIAELLNQQVVIPPGVRYKETTPEVNRKAIDALTNAFITSKGEVKSGDILDEIVTCGAGLWRKIKDDTEVKKISADLITLQAVTKDGTPKVAGKVFKGKKRVQVFWQAFRKQYNFDKQATIRRPTPKEIRLYWVMVPYDIPEPVFVVHSKTAVILAQFDKKTMKIGWIDDYLDKSLFQEWLPKSP